jgi:erythromycin esterase-like protein
MAERLFRDRSEAGRVLAGLLEPEVVGWLRDRFSGSDGQAYGFGAAFGADDWEGPAERRRVRPALADSVEELFQFDAVIHIDETRAVEPLERSAGWERGEAPETYPFAV